MRNNRADFMVVKLTTVKAEEKSILTERKRLVGRDDEPSQKGQRL
jgi:hypothetical protein